LSEIFTGVFCAGQKTQRFQFPDSVLYETLKRVLLRRINAALPSEDFWVSMTHLVQDNEKIQDNGNDLLSFVKGEEKVLCWNSCIVREKQRILDWYFSDAPEEIELNVHRH
jgi:hypothetical protein